MSQQIMKIGRLGTFSRTVLLRDVSSPSPRSFSSISPRSFSSTSRHSFSSTKTSLNLFSGSKKHGLEAPSGKAETASNPADLFKKNDILMYSDKPMNYIESVKVDGFHLANNLLIKSPDKDGNIIGTVLLHSETFEVDLNDAYKIINGFIVEFDETKVLEIFKKVHPKPELVVVGLGKQSRMLSDVNKRFFSSIGIQLEVGDSNNAAQMFDLLATERPNVIGALLLPPNV